MDNGRHNSHPVSSWTVNNCYTNSYFNQTSEEYGPDLLSTHYSDVPGGQWHGQDVYSTGQLSTAYSAATPHRPTFDTLPYAENYVDGSSFHSHKLGSAHSISQQLLSCDHTSQAPVVVSCNDLYNLGGDQDMGAHPSGAPPEQWGAQAVTGPKLNPTPPHVAPLLPEGNVANVVSKLSAQDRPAHDSEKCCPVCPASIRRPQDRKRHKLLHLPHWLQCPDPGCPWRGDRWEHLRKHRLKVHPSSSQEPDMHQSMIYNPWPFVERMIDDNTFEDAKAIAITLVEVRAKELKKLELWKDLWGRKKRRSRKVYGD